MTVPWASYQGMPRNGPRDRPSLAEELCEAIARELINSGRIPERELLPPEKELSTIYGVSRPTVREALLMLQHAGIVAIRHGVGTVVLPRPPTLTNGLDRLCSVETFAREAGETIDTTELEWEAVPADPELATTLEVPLGHPVMVVRRVKALGGKRAGYIIDHIPEGVIPFDLLKDEFHGSTLDVILDHPEVGAEYADSDIEPVNLSADIAERLEAPPGVAALFLNTVVRTAEGRPVDWGRCWYLPKAFRFAVRRRRQIGQRIPPTESRLSLNEEVLAAHFGGR
ncbi:MAG: GntR family transcriptional regulator [Thermoleophilaceae bacterium]|jgi:GntR family transcriptional regulator|nr:GntR family transcriptional regulator [Thermoleophilaceae bacterium]MEA2454711.1 GntR family transcriptional regulator [Thermoleophilaceae bacterium]